MAPARRRHRHGWRLLAAISAAFFLSLLFLLSFLAPPLREHPAVPERRFLRFPRPRGSSEDRHVSSIHTSLSLSLYVHLSENIHLLLYCLVRVVSFLILSYSDLYLRLTEEFGCEQEWGFRRDVSCPCK
jgi:NADH:ubiquinone oxidoreductase subunit 5 (subunit L)/multisubunit Na+/H+ antiporter MnhA subunit